MFGNVGQSNSFDGILIDARNERPLVIALVTIIVVWSMAFALTFASGHPGGHAAYGVGGATAISVSTER